MGMLGVVRHCYPEALVVLSFLCHTQVASAWQVMLNL